MTVRDEGEVIDRMFAALSAGNLDAAAACLTPDARIWHSFDCVAHDRSGIMAEWEGLVANFPERRFVDVRRQSTASGFVQQHVMAGRTGSGTERAWPVCIVVRMENGLIARLDEYIDRAGSFQPEGDGALKTPGL